MLRHPFSRVRETPIATMVTASIRSRRDALRGLGRGVAGILMLAGTPACSRPTAQPKEDDDAFLQRLLASPHPRIPVRTAPYRVTRTLRIPAGTTVSIETGVRLQWSGPVGSPTSLIGVFEADGGDTGLVAGGNGAIIECATPSPFVYAALMRGFSGFTVTGIHARECQHVHVNAAVEVYAKVRLDGPEANAARNVHITGGGASYAKPQTAGHGACLLHYARSCTLRGARYRNIANGVQWWGGNADPARAPAEGVAVNERKCRDILIEHVSAENVAGAGIWGAMGSNVTVRDCIVSEVGDVGFDAEGCNAVTFERCTGHNARNGCFSTFFLCNGVRFVDCTGIVDDKAFPLVRVYNESQINSDNTGLEIVGGTFECRDRRGPGTIDTAMGPVGTLAITGATLKNVRIDVAHSNMHFTTIARNTLDLPCRLGSFAAISAGSSKSLQNAATVIAGAVVVEDNIIRYTADPGPDDAAIGIALREDDFNSSAIDVVRRNHVAGPFRTGVVLISASANAGIVPSFSVSANTFNGLAPTARLLSISCEGAHSHQPTVRWDAAQMRDGRTVTLARALG